MKMKVIVTTSLLLITSCAYKPIVDTGGRSGTFSSSRAEELTNDIQHCEKLAEDNSSALNETAAWFSNNILRPYTLWLAPKEERTRETYVRNCLKGRGHNVIN